MNEVYCKIRSGCNETCPCRRRINCPAYIDITEQQVRLKFKSPERMDSIRTWFDDYFRVDFEQSDNLGNG